MNTTLLQYFVPSNSSKENLYSIQFRKSTNEFWRLTPTQHMHVQQTIESLKRCKTVEYNILLHNLISRPYNFEGEWKLSKTSKHLIQQFEYDVWRENKNWYMLDTIYTFHIASNLFCSNILSMKYILRRLLLCCIKLEVSVFLYFFYKCWFMYIPRLKVYIFVKSRDCVYLLDT